MVSCPRTATVAAAATRNAREQKTRRMRREKRVGANERGSRFSTKLFRDELRAAVFVTGGADLSFPWSERRSFIVPVNTFDRHLLREWLQILGLVLAATCGLLLVQVLYDDFRQLRDLGARGSALWLYLAV